MMPHASVILLAVLGAVAGTTACVIPTQPLSNNITEGFSIFVQNPAFPIIHDHIMNFRPNGVPDQHLVIRPGGGNPTGDTLFLQNGMLRYATVHAVIDLEYNPMDDTTKMFMTDRSYHPVAIFQPVYGCDPDTDELQIRLQLVSRLSDPPVVGGQIGVRQVVGIYEVRYSPPGNTLVDQGSPFIPVDLVIFRGSDVPTTTVSTTTTASTTSTTSATTTASTTTTSSTFTTSTTTTSSTSTTSTSTTSTTSTSTTTTSTTSTNPTSTAPSIGDYEFVSCWAEPATGRTLTERYFREAGMTNEICATRCAGLKYMGTQWNVECFCGSTLGAGSAAAPSADCSYACSGNPLEICGGSRRLSLYQLKAASSGSSTTTTTATTSSTTSSTASSTTSTTSTTSSASATTTSTQTTTTTTTSTTPSNSAALPPVGKYSFVSCYTEPPAGRALPALVTSADDMTLEKCATTCSAYAYFGTEWNRECWCDNVLTQGSAPAPLSECNYPCTGNAQEMCGGSRRLSLYHDPSFVGPAQPSNVGNYAFYGCVTDAPGARTLTGGTTGSAAMTLELCATTCAAYKYFGTEYSVECWCGNSLTQGAALVDISQCSMTCGGNKQEFCGNGNRLSVYERIAP